MSPYQSGERLEIFGLHSYRRGGTERYFQPEPEPKDRTGPRMEVIHRNLYCLPTGAIAKLNRYFFEGKGLVALAAERRVAVKTMKASLHTAIEILRHLCKKEEVCA